MRMCGEICRFMRDSLYMGLAAMAAGLADLNFSIKRWITYLKSCTINRSHHRVFCCSITQIDHLENRYNWMRNVRKNLYYGTQLINLARERMLISPTLPNCAASQFDNTGIAVVASVSLSLTRMPSDGTA